MQAPGCRGAALPIVDVTIPGRASFLDGIAVCFSLMPLFLGLMTIAGMIWTRKLSLLCAVFFWIVLIVLCEVLKGIVPGDRPFGSCAVSSGHGPTVVITAFAFLAWLILEMIFHQPQILRLYRLGYVVAACMLLGPIPAARSRLRDHSALQLGIGVILGLCAGVAWFLLMKFLIGGRVLRWIGLVKARVKCLQFVNIKNDYFTSREVYEEQVRKYKEEGIMEQSKRKSEGLGGVDFEEEGEDHGGENDGGVSENRRNHEDIFGDSASSGSEHVTGGNKDADDDHDDDDDRATSAPATDLEEALTPPSSGRDAGGATKNSKVKSKNRINNTSKNSGGGGKDYGDIGNSMSVGSGAYASPLVPFASPFGLDADGTPRSFSSPKNGHQNAHATAAPPEFDPSAASVSARQGQSGSKSFSPRSPASPAKSALKAATSYGHYGNGQHYSNNASDSNEASGRPGVRAGFVAFAE